MDIDKLKQLIEDALKGDVFTLDTAVLSSPAITAIAKDYFPKGTINLTGVPPLSPEPQSITVKGTGVDIPFKDMAVEAKFYIADSEAALTLTATGDAAWTLDKSIPAFDDTLGASVRFSVTPAPPTLFLLSNAADDKEIGLTFAGTIDFSAMTTGISALLGITNEHIEGPVVLKTGGTEFESIDFTGPTLVDRDLWIVKKCNVTFNMGSNILPNPESDEGVPLPYIELASYIPFSASGTDYKLPIAVQVINLENFVRFTADMSGAVKATLDALSSLINGTVLGGLLPSKSSFPIENLLTFTELYVDFDVNGKQVQAVGMQVASVEPWTIVHIQSTDKTFYAKNVKLDFCVITPFSGAKPYLNLGGEITLTDKASLYVSASAPDFEVQGYLTEDSVLNIKDFIAQFVGNPSGVPEDLVINQLGFDLKSGYYSFEIDILGYWPINGEKSLTLAVEQLGFSVLYTEEEKTANFSGMLRVDTVDITVTANYSASEAGKGWEFSGSTGEGQLIKIGDFVTYLTKTFGVGAPPKWIQDISLQDLKATLNTLSKNFTFSVTANIELAKNTLQIVVDFEMKAVEDGAGYEKILGGTLTLNKKHIFTLKFTSSPSDTNISAEWEIAKEGEYLQFKDIATAFGLGDDFPDIPEGVDLALKKATLFYDFTDKKQALVLSAESANYGKAVFVAKKIDDAWTYVFGIDVKVKVNLDQLPLVGSNLASIVGPIGLNGFKLVGTSKEIIDKNVPGFNDLIKAHAVEGSPTLPDIKEGIQKGLYAAIDLDLGNDNSYEVQVSTASKKAKAIELMLTEDKPVKDDNTYWVTLEKTIGPVYFEKAGVGYKDGRVILMLNASLVFTALKIDLIELGVSNPLTEIKPNFELSGLSISYQSGPVQIAAGFLKRKVGENIEYSGTAIVGIKAFNLSAMGSYASVEGHPSLFIFAMLTSPPLGGPPAFFVTGIAAGFGYNRGLRLPSIDTVTQFPLVSGFVPNQDSPFSGPDPGKALGVLIEKDVVPISIGQNWLAAGVQFTSFELIQSFALLAVAFGTDLEIGLIGLATISVPPKVQPAVAFAQLALSVKILPNEGLVAVDAKLTPASYLLSKACLLTGGFAFYLWTAPNEHEGDFVVTLGGYHPNFVPPDYYPKVPRLGFNWVVNKEVLIKGGMYFALTPTCVMVGGSLEATFTSGDLHAWFTIGADFLIAWKPYYYTAHMYLSFGVSYTFSLDLLFTTITETISVSLGADLNVWGPEFSGVAQIHLWIISFDISFGSTPNTPPAAIKWDDFKESFLPPSTKKPLRKAAEVNADEPEETDTYCKGQVAKGLVKDLTKETENDAIEMSWIVNRNLTTLETNTIFPAKDYKVIIKGKNGIIPDENLVYTNEAALKARNKEFGVGLVEVENEDFHSEHVVTIDYHGNLNPLINYEVTAIIRGVPKSLWQKRETGFDDNAIVPNVLVGFSITPIAPIPSKSVPIDLEYFKYRQQPYLPNIDPAKPTFITGPAQIDAMNELKKTINAEPTKTVRANIIASLKKRGVPVNPDVNVEQIAASAENFIFAPPVLSYTYWKKSA